MDWAWNAAYALTSEHGWSWGLIAARVTGLASTAPAWSTPGLGWRLRVALILLITFVVAPVVNGSWARPSDPMRMGQMVIAEVAVGAAMGMSFALVIAGARQAGEMVGIQAGLSPASLFDPEAGDTLNPIGHLYGLMALGAFLAMDGPLMLVGSLVESYRAMPPGDANLSVAAIDEAFGRVGWALALSVRAAAPVALALAMAGMALGWIGKAAPSLQMMTLSLPIRIGVGLMMILLGLAIAAEVFTGAFL